MTKKVYVGEMNGRRDGVIILSDLCTVFDVQTDIRAVCHRDDLQQLKIRILY